MRLTKEREAEIRDQIALMRARLSYQHQRWTRADACTRLSLTSSEDLLAELDAVRAERDSLRTALDTQPKPSTVAAAIAQMARDMVHRGKHSVEGLAVHIQRSLDAARADERAKVVAWLRGAAKGGAHYSAALGIAADSIERGEHEGTEGRRVVGVVTMSDEPPKPKIVDIGGRHHDDEDDDEDDEVKP